MVAVNVGEDCPVFDGMYEFCQLSTGGSVGKKFHGPLINYFCIITYFWHFCSLVLLQPCFSKDSFLYIEAFFGIGHITHFSLKDGGQVLLVSQSKLYLFLQRVPLS